MARVHGYAVSHGPREGETILLLHGGFVAGWMWEPQVEQLPGRHLLTPDLAPFGNSSDRPWPGLAGLADDVAALVRSEAVGGRAHVVGLSLGGVVATFLTARHPELVLSTLVSGAPLTGVHGVSRRLGMLQLPLVRQRWFWTAQSRLMGLDAESRRYVVDPATAVSPEHARQMLLDVLTGDALPDGLDRVRTPFLAVAGSGESRQAAAAFPALQARVPHLQTWVAPGMRHAWSSQDPALFTEMVVAWVDEQRHPSSLPAAAHR